VKLTAAAIALVAGVVLVVVLAAALELGRQSDRVTYPHATLAPDVPATKVRQPRKSAAPKKKCTQLVGDFRGQHESIVAGGAWAADPSLPPCVTRPGTSR
jgi:hypothetical protein